MESKTQVNEVDFLILLAFSISRFVYLIKVIIFLRKSDGNVP